jgi:glycosyltransferase involved in cell wall biosynthesis
MLRLSVITPCYNHADYLGRNLASVHGQQGPFDLEHIVVDGGSTDGTVDLLETCEYEVRWVSEPDRGQAHALNKGLRMAEGDVIGWLNSDDLYLPGALAAVAEVFESEPDTQWLFGRVIIVDEQDREIRKAVTRYKDHHLRRQSYGNLLAENTLSQMGVFWRAEAGRRIGPFDESLHYTMDYDYWLRLASVWPGRFLDRRLAAFRWYPRSKSGSGFRAQFGEQYAVAKRHADGRHRGTLLLHRLHVAKTLAAYSLMSRLRRLTG